MISKHFSYNYSFDEIVDNDPTKQDSDNYWYLNTSDVVNYSWRTDVFSEEDLERISVIGKRLEKRRAETGGAGVHCLTMRRSFVSWISPNNITSWIFQKLTSAVIDSNNSFFNFDLTKIERLQFTYYNGEENGFYNRHMDSLYWNIPHNRKLSFVVQLSDPSEYEGGELVLHTGPEPIVIEKRKGLIVFFPSYILHEVTPVTKGERYSLVGWVHGPPFK